MSRYGLHFGIWFRNGRNSGKESCLRRWLNGEFFKMAFSEGKTKLMQEFCSDGAQSSLAGRSSASDMESLCPDILSQQQ